MPFFLACKKHFEDDIQRKLTDLGVNGNERKEIVADIFGSEVTRERGLQKTWQNWSKYGTSVKRPPDKPVDQNSIHGLCVTKPKT